MDWDAVGFETVKKGSMLTIPSGFTTKNLADVIEYLNTHPAYTIRFKPDKIQFFTTSPLRQTGAYQPLTELEPHKNHAARLKHTLDTRITGIKLEGLISHFETRRTGNPLELTEPWPFRMFVPVWSPKLGKQHSVGELYDRLYVDAPELARYI